MSEYCPVCCLVVAPNDPEAREHQNKRVHGSCFHLLEQRFPKVMSNEHPEENPPVFRRVQPLKIRGNPFVAPRKTLDAIEK